MASADAADRVAEATSPARFQITFVAPDGATHQVEAAADEYVLDAGLQAGLDLPYRCLQGWCLTCAARLIDGHVDQHDSRRYYEADRAAGFMLPCTGRPKTDLVIETYARDAMRAARAERGLPFPKGDWGKRQTNA